MLLFVMPEFSQGSISPTATIPDALLPMLHRSLSGHDSRDNMSVAAPWQYFVTKFQAP
jgi:hypothetical protein